MTTATGELALTTVEPSDDEAIRQWYELRCAVVRADLPEDPEPCWIDQLGQFRAPWPGEDETVWLARRDGTVVGGCVLTLPTRDNLDNALVDILVAPGHRRRGIGRTLLEHLSAAASRHGRVRLIAMAAEPFGASSPGAAFAAVGGAQRALVDTRRRLDLAAVAPAMVERLRADALARSDGYSVVQWLDSTPERWLDDLAYLTGRMLADAPLDDLRLEPEVYDAERIRERDASSRARGHHTVSTGACDPGGRPAGRVHPARRLLRHRLVRRPVGHTRGAGTSGAPAGNADQDRQPRSRPRSPSRTAGRRHLQRRLQPLHGRHQRPDGIPPARPLGRVANRAVTGCASGE